jgi:hypothetical protein
MMRRIEPHVLHTMLSLSILITLRCEVRDRDTKRQSRESRERWSEFPFSMYVNILGRDALIFTQLFDKMENTIRAFEHGILARD